MSRPVELRLVPPSGVEGAVDRYDVPGDAPFYVAHAPVGATAAGVRAIQEGLRHLEGTIVVLPAGWSFQVFEAAPASSAPPVCGSCGASLDVDRRCVFCEAAK